MISVTLSTYLVKQLLDFKLCALYLYFLSIIHFLNYTFPIFVSNVQRARLAFCACFPVLLPGPTACRQKFPSRSSFLSAPSLQIIRFGIPVPSNISSFLRVRNGDSIVTFEKVGDTIKVKIFAQEAELELVIKHCQ